MPNDRLEVTERSRVRRLHTRGSYDRDVVYAILDATPLCHVGTVQGGRPVVTPTLQWREGDRVYWHGSSASRALRAARGREVCLTVSLLDGLVLARSAFHHSANYRSVMLFGTATEVADRDEKLARLRTFLEGLHPGRWEALRPIQEKELKATAVLWLPIREGSAKLRVGHAVDDEADYELPIWAGILPVVHGFGPPVPDPRNLAGVEEPASLRTAKLG